MSENNYPKTPGLDAAGWYARKYGNLLPFLKTTPIGSQVNSAIQKIGNDPYRFLPPTMFGAKLAAEALADKYRDWHNTSNLPKIPIPPPPPPQPASKRAIQVFSYSNQPDLKIIRFDRRANPNAGFKLKYTQGTPNNIQSTVDELSKTKNKRFVVVPIQFYDPYDPLRRAIGPVVVDGVYQNKGKGDVPGKTREDQTKVKTETLPNRCSLTYSPESGFMAIKGWPPPIKNSKGFQLAGAIGCLPGNISTSDTTLWRNLASSQNLTGQMHPDKRRRRILIGLEKNGVAWIIAALGKDYQTLSPVDMINSFRKRHPDVQLQTIVFPDAGSTAGIGSSEWNHLEEKKKHFDGKPLAGNVSTLGVFYE